MRFAKGDLATLVAWEVGKILPEARGEVQEDDRHLRLRRRPKPAAYGKTIASERPGHRLTEYWHPLGPGGRDLGVQFSDGGVGLERDDRPGVRRPDRVEAVGKDAAQCDRLPGIVQRVSEHAQSPAAFRTAYRRWREVGQALAASPLLPLISATGSVPMGRAVAKTVADRLGRSLLELGGNNGMIVAPSADLDLAVRSIVFAAAGTCGQRCTTLRRLIVHESIADELRDRILAGLSEGL